MAAIERAGGRVMYDFEWTNRNTLAGSRITNARMARDLIGVDYFGHLTDVWLYLRIQRIRPCTKNG